MMQAVYGVVAAGLIVATGLLGGMWTGRWKTSDRLERAAAALDRLPMQIGDWRGVARELDKRETEKARLDGYVMRVYRHRVTGTELNVLMMCGRPGPIAVHTPDVCFQGAGFELQAQPKRYPVSFDGQDAEMFMGDFRDPESPVPGHICVLWSWSTGGPWQATDHPRLTFASAP